MSGTHKIGKQQFAKHNPEDEAIMLIFPLIPLHGLSTQYQLRSELNLMHDQIQDIVIQLFQLGEVDDSTK